MQVKMQGQLNQENKEGWTDLLLSVCCVYLPMHPSVEVNFGLPKQFSNSVSSIVPPVFFRGVISNKLKRRACRGTD
jgi:hypothetical protein